MVAGMLAPGALAGMDLGMTATPALYVIIDAQVASPRYNDVSEIPVSLSVVCSIRRHRCYVSDVAISLDIHGITVLA